MHDLELPDNALNTPPAKNDLRKSLRNKRRTLSRQQQRQASMGLCRQLSRLPEFLFGQRIAA